MTATRLEEERMDPELCPICGDIMEPDDVTETVRCMREGDPDHSLRAALSRAEKAEAALCRAREAFNDYMHGNAPKEKIDGPSHVPMNLRLINAALSAPGEGGRVMYQTCVCHPSAPNPHCPIHGQPPASVTYSDPSPRCAAKDAELTRLRSLATRWYLADGTFEMLPEAVVILRRKKAAKTLARTEKVEAALCMANKAFFPSLAMLMVETVALPDDKTRLNTLKDALTGLAPCQHKDEMRRWKTEAERLQILLEAFRAGDVTEDLSLAMNQNEYLRGEVKRLKEELRNGM